MPPADGSVAPAEAASALASRAERPRILGFAADEVTENALRGGLADIAPDLIIRRGDAALATRQLAREPTPGVLIVDIAESEDGLAALEALAAVCVPDVRVLVIGDRSDIPFYRALTQELGVVEYLFKPLTRDRVARLFGPHVAVAAPTVTAERGGSVTAVCGARGGAGASTVAVNLALLLASTTRGHVALLDLHLRGGTAALMLGAAPGSGLRAGLENPDRVDALFLDRVSLPVEERVRLIAAEEPLEAEFSASPAAVARVLEVLRLRFNHVVVDLPSPPGPAERAVLAAARHRVVVLAPDVAGIRDTEALRRLCAGAGNGRTYTVLNRAGASGWLPAEVVREGLGAAPDATIPDLPDRLPKAANLGRPAVRECTALRRALNPLAQEISGHVEEKAPGALRALVRRLARR
jgi:pilus assembly protein CpaE